MQVECEGGGNLQPVHEGKGGAVGEGELLVAISLKKAPGLRHIRVGDLEHGGERGIEKAPPELNRGEVTEACLDQVQRLHEDEVGRNQWDIVLADKRHGGSMMVVGSICEGEVGGGIDEDQPRYRISGHDPSRRGPDVGSR